MNTFTNCEKKQILSAPSNKDSSHSERIVYMHIKIHNSTPHNTMMLDSE
jgi:hypothetical protein